MTTKKNYLLAAALTLVCLGASGCEDEDIARQTARQLRVAVLEDERLIDNNIAGQKEFYDKQRKTINDARTANIEFRVDAFRRMRSAQAATRMSLDPDTEARLANLMDYLHETHDKEYELWQELLDGDQQAREDLKSKVAKLERQKKLLEQVKKNLEQLALSPRSKKRALALLKFTQETYAAYKTADQ